MPYGIVSDIMAILVQFDSQPTSGGNRINSIDYVLPPGPVPV